MIQRIKAADVVPLRWDILRPGFPRETAVFEGDALPWTQHFGAFDEEDRLVGVASIYLTAMPEHPEILNAWQLRGMATAPAVRGAGFGRELVLACEQAAAATDAALIWCNARTSAAPFYRRFGWKVEGKEFDIPTVGPHFRMWRKL